MKIMPFTNASDLGGAFVALMVTNLFRSAKVAPLPPSDNLCDQEETPNRHVMCKWILAGIIDSRALYRLVNSSNVKVDESVFKLADPNNVTHLSGFHEELTKYMKELKKLDDSLKVYTESDDYQRRWKSIRALVNSVIALRQNIMDMYATVHHLIISLDMLKGPIIKPMQMKTASTSATKVDLKYLSIIRSETNYVARNLMALLNLWRKQCDACGDF